MLSVYRAGEGHGLFIFDGNACEGRIPVGFDEFNAACELMAPRT